MTMMNEVLYERMCEHIGHRIEIASYASRENVAVECVTCGCVIVDVNQKESDNV